MTDMYFDVQHKTDKQHILDNPDTYIGSVETVEANMWVMSDDGAKIVEKSIHYIPGLFKLFDEGIVNCRDHVVRMQAKIEARVENSLPVTYIDVTIQPDGTIVMTNDGNGMDVAQHPEEKIWIPELIFAHLRTSTNYNKDEKKIVGGKNGFGFKLVLIWSTYGRIETVDHIRGLKYVQEFKNNLEEICPPKITPVKKAKPYTKITFKPDYQRLGLSSDSLDADTIALLQKRVYDISAITDKTIKVKYNGALVPTKNFEQYIQLYFAEKTPIVYEEGGVRWEYAVAMTPTNEFVQVSFVNGIYTPKGGKHVEYILNQILRKLADLIEKKKKIRVNTNTIKEQLFLFLRCDIENPSFDSQSKDCMNTAIAKFGSKCEVSEKFVEKVAKLGVVDTACAIHGVKETNDAKKTDGRKRRTIQGIPKLNDANWAGTEKSRECMILFCEGDSAKTGVISGLSADDRNVIGVYPLKGKVMNVRGETVKKIAENKEITEMKKILGLEIGKKYNSIEDVHKHLRYSKIVFMTDQDLDGSHIKGLCINLFEDQWESLTRIPGFIGFMNTPILKATKGKQTMKFYNQGEYDAWKQTQQESDLNKWTIKYFKGLGTSSKTEFQEYFQEKKFVGFEHTGAASTDAIDMAFNKKRADDRKTWLEKVYNRASFADTSKQLIPYEEFIHKELIHFSKYDCDRNIPNMVDGLKTSQRKILFAAFKRRLTAEIKVAQFSAYVSEHSAYHHGEQSLNDTIIGMAQNFVGSNNLNLLFPSGQFGSRIMGGKDAASPRYIFTLLEKITRLLFVEQDDAILHSLFDDGVPVEPQFYVPILPMVLVNGAKGIGTGFSTDIMCYRVLDIIAYLRQKLKLQSIGTATAGSAEPIEFFPYYEGFRGTIERVTDGRFVFKGKYERISDDTVRVTELPVGFWTEDFKDLVEKWMTDGEKEGKYVAPVIKKMTDNSTDTTVDYELTFCKGKVDELEAIKEDYGCNGLEKLLKLYCTKSTTNMNLFDASDKLRKYNTVEEIIDDYFGVRLLYYEERKKYLLALLAKEIEFLKNKVRYIQEVLEGTIDLRKKTRQQINEMLEAKQYQQAGAGTDGGFSYLVKMSMDSVSEENVQKLMKEYQEKQEEIERLSNTSIEQLWLKELEIVEKAYLEYQQEREKAQSGATTKSGGGGEAKKKRAISKPDGGATKRVKQG